MIQMLTIMRRIDRSINRLSLIVVYRFYRFPFFFCVGGAVQISGASLGGTIYLGIIFEAGSGRWDIHRTYMAKHYIFV